MNITMKAVTHVHTRLAEMVNCPRPCAVSADCLATCWSDVGSNMCGARDVHDAARASMVQPSPGAHFARVSRACLAKIQLVRALLHPFAARSCARYVSDAKRDSSSDRP